MCPYDINNANASTPFREAFRASTSDYESSDQGSIPGWVHFFLCLAPFTMYQKPGIDHCPWRPSSQFNKWHAQNKLLSSSLIFIGSMHLVHSPPHQPRHQRTIVAARLTCIANRVLIKPNIQSERFFFHLLVNILFSFQGGKVHSMGSH
jgi:hypothetical protein